MEKQDDLKHDGWLFKQSSELEILISAAIVYAAFQIHDVVPQLIASLLNNNLPSNSPIVVYASTIALFLGTLLPISILAHFIIRFYWLSLVGLRTAFSDTKKSPVNFAPQYIKKTFESNFIDNHIVTIDRICSSIFAFSFLVIFAFCLSLFSVFLIGGFIFHLINETFSDSFIQYFFVLILIIFLIMCFLTFIDFFTLGSLKKIKNRWFIRVYYPMYRVMGLITLSFFYRGIYYTFIQKISKTALAILLPAYVIITILLLNLGFYESRIYDESIGDNIGNQAIANLHYADHFEESTILYRPFIPSFYIKDTFLEVSLPLTPELDKMLVTKCDSVIAINEEGFHWRKWINTGFNTRDIPKDFNITKNAEHALDCFAEKTTLLIDSAIMRRHKFRFRNLQTPEKIVLTSFLDIKELERGEHTLTVRLEGEKDHVIPFIKE